MADEPLARCSNPTVRLWLQTATRGSSADVSGFFFFSSLHTVFFFFSSLHTGSMVIVRVKCTRYSIRSQQLSAARQGPAKAGQRWEEQRRGVEVSLVHIMCARVREASTVRKSVPARWRLTRRAGRRWGKGGGREDGCMCAPGSAGRRRNAWQRSRRRCPPSEVSVVSRVSSNSVESVQ